MNVKRKRALTLLSGMAALALAPRIARAQAVQTIRMVIVSGETSATAYYAKELGMFAKAGIEAEITEVTTVPLPPRPLPVVRWISAPRSRPH